MTDEQLQEAIAEMREYIQQDVKGGFCSDADTIDNAIALFPYAIPLTEIRNHAVEIFQEVLLAHVKDQGDWPEETDCDRLDAAFNELEHTGIIARQNFSCCGTCGMGEIADEMDRVAGRGRLVRGYVYYNVQDTCSAVEGRGLYLAYGASRSSEDNSLAVAREVVAALQRHGFAVTWDGTQQRRIHVRVDWRRRRRPDVSGSSSNEAGPATRSRLPGC